MQEKGVLMGKHGSEALVENADDAELLVVVGLGALTDLVDRLEGLHRRLGILKNLYSCKCVPKDFLAKGNTKRQMTEGIGMLTDLVNKLEDQRILYKCNCGSEGLFGHADDTLWQGAGSPEKMEDVEEKMGDNVHVVVRPGPTIPPGLDAAADLESGKPYFAHRAIGRACWDPPTLQEEEERQLRIVERPRVIRQRVG